MMLQIDPPVHPGEYLTEEYLTPLGLTAEDLATRLHVPASTIEPILAGRASLDPAMALRLARLFGTTPQFWMAYQSNFDLATQATRLRDELATIRTIEAA